MKKLIILLVSILLTQGIQGQNKWGYILKITDTNYVPTVTCIDSSGWLTLTTGIDNYDSIFARHNISEFYASELMSYPLDYTLYILVCDNGVYNMEYERGALRAELLNNFGNVIPYIVYAPIFPDQEVKYGYMMEIIDENYIPQVTDIDSCYVKLTTGIDAYDSIFSKYAIKSFNHYFQQYYHLVCNEENGELAREIREKFSNVVPMIEEFVLRLTLLKKDEVIDNSESVVQNGNLLYFNGISLPINISFFDLDGRLLFNDKAVENIYNPYEKIPSEGLYLFQITTNTKQIYTGKYFKK